MTKDPLTKDVGNRICKHMNADHQEALLAFAKYYGHLENPSKAKMLSINAESMNLEVDGEALKIMFDHLLKDSEDAHSTLVSMVKGLPKP